MKMVIIKSVPIRHHSYYQWLLLGFYELEQKKEIRLKFRLPIYQSIYYFIFNDYLRRQSFRLISRYHLLKSESYALLGISIEVNGEPKKFAYDVADSPFVFDPNYLKLCDTYFKAQCPKVIDESGYRLTDQVFLPYTKETLIYREKIKPAMLGCRRLSWSIKFTSLKKAYNDYIYHQTIKKDKFLMCYFGSAKGPTFSLIQTEPANFDGESLIMGFFGEKLQHPNEKRYQLFRLIRKLGDKCDARVINKTGVKDDAIFLTKDETIPLKDFTGYISHFQYNANVSGFRLSIPNRFIESFMVGTAIVTDQLSVKWYLDFEDEVVELAEMGYLPNDQVDWKTIEEKLSSLKSVDALKVLESYNKKWAPEPFTRYIVEATGLPAK